MRRLIALALPCLLAVLSGCDKAPSREQQIRDRLPLESAYTHNIERMAELLTRTHPRLSAAQIEPVLRQYLTVEDQRKDLYELYSEAHFSDAEFDTLVTATQNPEQARALEQTEAGRALSIKLTNLMRERAQDPRTQALAEQRLAQVEAALKALDGSATATPVVPQG